MWRHESIWYPQAALKNAFGNNKGVYKHPRPLYTKMNQTFIYFENISIIEVKDMKIKVLTHIVRLSDGHVMPSWEHAKDEFDASRISKMVRSGELDTEGYAVRIRRSPKERHAIDVKLDDDAWGFW